MFNIIIYKLKTMLIVVATRTMRMPASLGACEGGGGGKAVFVGGDGVEVAGTGGGEGETAHVAAVSVPTEEQELVPETVYPDSHVGWHIKPLARELVQLPTPPFVGAVDASHGCTA